MYVISETGPEDASTLAALLRAYMLETYQEEWKGGASLADHLGMRFRALVAKVGAQAVAFAAWEIAYDLHHCMSGGHVLDLYVAPRHRSRGIAVELMARVAGVVHSTGGAFIKGAAVDAGTGSRLYARFAPAFGNDYILGGRAFRHLASQAALPARKLARSLPRLEWNFEP